MQKDTKIIIIVCSGVVLTFGLGYYIYQKRQNGSASSSATLSIAEQRAALAAIAKSNSNPSGQAMSQVCVLKNLPHSAV